MTTWKIGTQDNEVACNAHHTGPNLNVNVNVSANSNRFRVSVTCKRLVVLYEERQPVEFDTTMERLSAMFRHPLDVSEVITAVKAEFPEYRADAA